VLLPGLLVIALLGAFMLALVRLRRDRRPPNLGA
jgi:hypothetical protein